LAKKNWTEEIQIRLGTNWGYIPEIHDGYVIMYNHIKIFGNKQQVVYEHLCKVWLNFAILFEKKCYF
jgi:hypothetical protein